MNRTKQILSLALVLALALAGLALAEEAAQPSEMALAYRELIQSVDYGDGVTYVIGHRHPDSDTVGSAIAYAYLLNQLGVNAQAAVAGDINNETRYALDCFGIEAPPIVDDAEGKQFVLVDHSAYTHAIDEMPLARIVGVVDHHGIGSVQNTESINVRSAPIGAAATLVYLAYRECEVPIPADMAQVMLMAILSDTANCERATEMDRIAYRDLVPLSGVEDVDALYQGMLDASANYEGMSDIDIFMLDYKEYAAAGVSFGMADAKACGEEEMAKLCDRMLAAMQENYDAIGLDMLFAKVNNISGNDGENQSYMVAYPESAQTLLDHCFGGADGDYYVFGERQSRKKHIIPALTAALETSAEDFTQIPAADLKRLRLGSSPYTVMIDDDFVRGEVSEAGYDDDQIACFECDDTGLDFDVYQFSKDGIADEAHHYVLEEASEYERVEGVWPRDNINGIDLSWYRAVESRDGEDCATLNFILDCGDEYVELVFWAANDDAAAEAWRIIGSLQRTELKTIRLGESDFTLDVPADFEQGDMTEEDIADDQVAYWYSEASLLDFDVYEFSKDGLPEALADYAVLEAADYEGVTEIETDAEVNGVPVAWYRAVEEYEDGEYDTVTCIFDGGDEYVEVVFWLDGVTAGAEADTILQSLSNGAQVDAEALEPAA